MQAIVIATRIAAPRERCFDLARDIDVHVATAKGTGERAVGERQHGLLGVGDVVTWEARHFGVTLRMTVRITKMDRPRSFEDAMVSGPFRSLMHRHDFDELPTGTLMRDHFLFESPFGLAGGLADALVLRRYLASFLKRRASALKAMAEA